MEKFFRQVGEKEKMQEAHLHLNPAMRGYEPLGETGRGRRGGEFFYPFFGRHVKFLTNLCNYCPDLKEAFTIGDCVHDFEQVSFYQSLYPHSSPLPSIPRSQNIWPSSSSAPGFREGMYAYYREIFPVAMKLVEIFGVALGVDSHDENENGGGDGGLEKDFQWPIWGMRALHYPPPPSCAEEEEGGEGEGEGGDGDGDEERMGLGAHKDFSWVTLVLQDEVGGLEVLNSEGKWIDVPPREGTLVVNVGQVSFFSLFFTLFFSLFSSFALLTFFTFFLFCLFPQPNLNLKFLNTPIPHPQQANPPPPPLPLFSVPRTPNQLPLPRNNPSRPQQIRPRTKKKIFHPLLSQSQPSSHTRSSSQLCKSRRGDSPSDQCRGFVYSKGVAGEEETSDECQVEKCARDGVEV